MKLFIYVSHAQFIIYFKDPSYYSRSGDMLIKYEQILIIYIPFFSVLADLSNDIWQSMLLVEYKNMSTENESIFMKNPDFQ